MLFTPRDPWRLGGCSERLGIDTRVYPVASPTTEGEDELRGILAVMGTLRGSELVGGKEPCGDLGL